MPVLEAESDLGKSIAAARKSEAGTIKEYAKGRRDTYLLNPFDIEIEDGFNARDINSRKTQEHIDNLAKSIKAIGLQRPLKVRMKNGRPILIDGECRLRATIRAIEVYGAEIRGVPVTPTDRAMNDAEATLSLVVENMGEPLDMLEKSVVFKRLASYGWTYAEIGERAGCTPVRVQQLIELSSVPERVKEMVRNDEISATLAWSIAKENDYDEERTVACIQAALSEARNSGKKRVTARHVGTRTSFKSSMASIFGDATVCVDEDDGEETVIVSFSREQFDQLQGLMKLNLL